MLNALNITNITSVTSGLDPLFPFLRIKVQCTLKNISSRLHYSIPYLLLSHQQSKLQLYQEAENSLLEKVFVHPYPVLIQTADLQLCTQFYYSICEP